MQHCILSISDALLRINSLGDRCGVSGFFFFACIQTEEDDSFRQKVRVLCVDTIYTNKNYKSRENKPKRPKKSYVMNYKVKEVAIYPLLYNNVRHIWVDCIMGFTIHVL